MMYEKMLLRRAKTILEYAAHCKAISIREEEFIAVAFVEHGVAMLEGQSEHQILRDALQQDIRKLVSLMNDLR